MPAPHCLNCNAALPPGQAYCGSCGQKADTHRVTMHDLVHALIHLFTHADHSVFGLVRDLVVRPGHVARAYIDGRRKHYFNPFTFVLVVVGVATLVLKATKFVTFGPTPNPVGNFLQSNLNLVILAQLPLLALFSSLLFRAEKLYFAEHLVLAAYTSGFSSIFLTLFVAPAWFAFHLPLVWTVAAYYALWFLYYGVACAQFFRGPAWRLALKGFVIAALAQFVSYLLISAIFWSWSKLRT